MMNLRIAVIACAVVAALSGSQPGSAQQGQPEPRQASGSAVPAWFLGMPVYLKPGPSGEGTPRKPNKRAAESTDGIPRMKVYLPAPVNQTAGNAPSRVIPTDDGMKVLPPHQDVFTELRSKAAPAIARAYFVLQGPKANDSNVHVQPDPGNSVPGGPLVYEMKIGHEWVKLNNHVAIEYGIREGLLTVKYFEDGGPMWGEFMDPGMESFNVQVAIQ